MRSLKVVALGCLLALLSVSMGVPDAHAGCGGTSELGSGSGFHPFKNFHPFKKKTSATYGGSCYSGGYSQQVTYSSGQTYGSEQCTTGVCTTPPTPSKQIPVPLQVAPVPSKTVPLPALPKGQGTFMQPPDVPTTYSFTGVKHEESSDDVSYRLYEKPEKEVLLAKLY